MLIDIIAFGLIILSVFKGVSKGFIVALFSFLAFIIGLAAALKLSAVVAEYLGANANISGRLLPVLAFLIVFIAVVLLVRIGAKLLEAGARLAMLGWLNRLGGILLYMLIYFFIFSIFLFYAVQLGLVKTTATETSISYRYIQPIAPWMMTVLGAILPFLKNTFSDLLHFFDGLSHQKQ